MLTDIVPLFPSSDVNKGTYLWALGKISSPELLNTKV